MNNRNHRRQKLTRLEVAIRIRESVWPRLGDPALFIRSYHQEGPCTLWKSHSFHVASMETPFFTSIEVWPIPNKAGLSKHPLSEGKVMNLHRSPYGQYDLVSFQHGDWEQELLRYVGAPLGLLSIKAVAG